MEVFLLALFVILFLFLINKISIRLDSMQDSIADLSRKLDQYKRQEPSKEKTVEGLISETSKPTPPPPVIQRPVIEKAVFDDVTRRPEPIVPKASGRPAAIDAPQLPRPAPQPSVEQLPQKSWWEKFKEQNPDLERFIGENLINKIGILILVLGISYLVKFAIDKEWINEPARVGVGILAGGIVMLVAHKLRKNYKAFSSVLVAGALFIFYFTIAVAFHDYHLFSQTVAFIIMVAITALSAFVSVSYDRVELAALSLIGGFAVPFMVSTGSGNYVVLLSYITILDIGILMIAYYKRWGLINILAYIFTIILYGVWLYGIEGDGNAPYGGALAFGCGFYLIFILMNIIYSIKNKTAFSNSQLKILVSNTFLFYAAGMLILDNWRPELKGSFTLLLGVFNFCFAWLLYKKLNIDRKVIYILIGLTLTFVTLAIPTQFENNYITLFWAAEAVVLMWLAQKSKIENFRFGSVIVHSLMLISLVLDWVELYYDDDLEIMLNPAFLTGLFAIASCLAVIQLLKRDTGSYKMYGIVFNVENYKKFVSIITLILVYFTGFIELYYQANYYLESSYAVSSFGVLYHLLFSIAFVQIYCIRKSERAERFGTLLNLINIVLFILIFSRLAYYEVEAHINTTHNSKLAYWLHIVALAVLFYSVWQVRQMNREKAILQFMSTGLFTYIAVFFLVYLASSELMLHGLSLSLEPINAADLSAAQKLAPYRHNGNDELTFILADRNIEIVRNQIIKTGFPVLWGLLACLLLLMGIKKQTKNLRIAALLLLGLTIAKLFIYDIRNASETGKIIAFILLGVLILVISFVYQKIKLLVIEDKPENKNDNETI